MAPDIEAVTALLQKGRVWQAVESHISKYQAEFAVHQPTPKAGGSPTNKT